MCDLVGNIPRDVFIFAVISQGFYLSKFYSFSINSSFNIDFAFFFLLSRKKEEKCSQKEERKTVVDFKRLAENSLKKHERILGT